MSEGLAQGLYVAARVGFEPAPLRTQSTKFTTEPPHLTKMLILNSLFLTWPENYLEVFGYWGKVSIDFGHTFYAFLGFYNRDGFIGEGFEPGKHPLNMPMILRLWLTSVHSSWTKSHPYSFHITVWL